MAVYVYQNVGTISRLRLLRYMQAPLPVKGIPLKAVPGFVIIDFYVIICIFD